MSEFTIQLLHNILSVSLRRFNGVSGQALIVNSNNDVQKDDNYDLIEAFLQ